MKNKVEELTIADLINLAKGYCPFAQKVILKKDISEDSNWSFVFEMQSKEVLNAVGIGEISIELGNPEQLGGEEDE